VNQFVISIIEGLTLGATYALIALGIIIIFRATDTFNFAHGEFMVLGAYLVARWQTRGHAPDIVVALVSLTIVAAAGWLLFRVVLRRIVGMPPFVGVVATLGFASIADGFLGMSFGSKQYSIKYDWLPKGTVTIFGARVSAATLAVAAVSLTIAAVAAAIVRWTQVGAKLRAAGQDVLLASQRGINVNRVYAGAWGVGCALAGVAGIAYGATNIVSTDMVSLGLVAFPAILLGGLDSIGGAIVGGIACGLVQSFTTSYIGGQWTDVATYSLLLVVILVKPSGLFGTKTVVRV
jgi:branched-chain amino acid transport system permease protein